MVATLAVPNSEVRVNFSIYQIFERILFLNKTELLHVNRLHHFLAVCYRGFFKRLTAAEFLYDAGFFEFAFESFESLLDVVAFFDLYDDHFLLFLIFTFLFLFQAERLHRNGVHSALSGAKLHTFFLLAKFFIPEMSLLHSFFTLFR